MHEKIYCYTRTCNNQAQYFSVNKIFSVNNARNLYKEIRLIITSFADFWPTSISKILETQRTMSFMSALPFQFFMEGLSSRFADGSSAIDMTLLFNDWVHYTLVTPGECWELIRYYTKLSIISVKDWASRAFKWNSSKLLSHLFAEHSWSTKISGEPTDDWVTTHIRKIITVDTIGVIDWDGNKGNKHEHSSDTCEDLEISIHTITR